MIDIYFTFNASLIFAQSGFVMDSEANPIEGGVDF